LAPPLKTLSVASVMRDEERGHGAGARRVAKKRAAPHGRPGGAQVACRPPRIVMVVVVMVGMMVLAHGRDHGVEGGRIRLAGGPRFGLSTVR